MDYDDIQDDDITWGDIILSDEENGNISDSAVSAAGAILPTHPFLFTPTPAQPNSLLNRRKDVDR